jgi:hypothetical protein
MMTSVSASANILEEFQERRETVKFGDFAVTLRPELPKNKKMERQRRPMA